MKSNIFLTTSLTLASALLAFSPASMALTDAECERLYGVTCNHQADIERRQSVVPEVCQAYPNSKTCGFVNEGGLQGLLDSWIALAITNPDLMQQFAQAHCGANRAAKEVGTNWQEVSIESFSMAAADGVVPNTQLEHDLWIHEGYFFVVNFCPEFK